MKKMINREIFRFLFKLIILFQLYSYQKIKTEATQLSQTNENVRAVRQFEKNDGNNLNDRMSQIEAKSQRQEKENSLLKTTGVEDKRIIRQLRGRVSSLESLMLTSNSETYKKLLLRPKRPYRLLPLHPASVEVRDKMEKEKAVADKRFYGPASNCNELGELGYTLNGYYLVKGKGESISSSIEAVMCQFNLPNESKEGTKEERLGFVKIGKNLGKSQTPGKENKIELVNSQLKINENELKATERNPLGSINSIGSIITSMKPLGAAYGIASPRQANLVNGFGKCLNVDPLTHGGLGLQQSDCNSNDITMLWSWNEVSLGSWDRHICNGRGRCVATPFNSADNALQITYHHMDEHGQRFSLDDSISHPAFYIIKNDHGKCLSVKGNTNQTGAQIWTRDCNPSEAGQRWTWHN